VKKAKLAFVAAAIAMLTVSPLAPSASAHGCPNPDYPCDPTPIDPSDVTHFVVCQIKNC
jgi:hypothetical protein